MSMTILNTGSDLARNPISPGSFWRPFGWLGGVPDTSRYANGLASSGDGSRHRRLVDCGIGIAAILMLLANVCAADPDAIDQIVLAEMKAQRIPGLALGVRRNGKIVQSRGYGLANVEHDVPVRAETVFQSGSVGKQFTAFATMWLMEQGKLRLDQSIREHLPRTPDSWQGITIRHLLTHTSGIGDSYAAIDLRKDYTERQLVRIASSVPVEFEPGAKWSYSNTGYQILGILIHKASGQFYGDLLEDRVFQPLGMRTARVISEADIVRDRAAGYRLVDGDLKNQDWVSPTLNTCADGALYLSVLDMLQWDAALNDRKILRPGSYQQLWQPVVLHDGTTHPYGFGWFLAGTDGHRQYSHGGAWQGFQTYYSRYVDDGLSIVVLANLAECDPGAIAARVAERYLPIPAKSPGK